MNFRYPIYLDLTGKQCVVTGEGYEVAAKVETLVEASAKVAYVNPAAVQEIEHLAANGQIVWHQREFLPQDLEGCFLIITSRHDNAEIFRMAEARGILCNAVDDPKNCRFSHGSIHRQGDLTIGISTNGKAPALAVRIKEMLKREIGPEYKALLDLMTEVRPEIYQRVKGFEQRKALWYRMVDSDALDLFRRGDQVAARNRIQELIEQAVSNT